MLHLLDHTLEFHNCLTQIATHLDSHLVWVAKHILLLSKYVLILPIEVKSSRLDDTFSAALRLSLQLRGSGGQLAGLVAPGVGALLKIITDLLVGLLNLLPQHLFNLEMIECRLLLLLLHDAWLRRDQSGSLLLSHWAGGLHHLLLLLLLVKLLVFNDRQLLLLHHLFHLFDSERDNRATDLHCFGLVNFKFDV